MDTIALRTDGVPVSEGAETRWFIRSLNKSNNKGEITRPPCDGEDSCCSNGVDGHCREGEGDCDADAECEGELVCGTDNCPCGDGDDCCREKTMSAAEAKGKK